jgi:signal transduction histidine kinase
MKSILVAEDSATQRELLHYTLGKAGFRVRVARHGREALHLAQEEVPDVVVTDIVMPEMDGYELCRQLKEGGRTRRVPVVLLTSLANPRDIIAGLQCGADSFIGKPFTEEYLLNRLRDVLANHELPERQRPDGTVQVVSGGESYSIKAPPPRTLDLLLSVYDAALRRNRDLQVAEQELKKLNRELERKFRDREQLLERERAAREEAERANRMKEEFLATVSHELRTPLSAISGWAQYLRQGEPSPEEVREALEVIERNAWAQTQIVEDLLDMSRIVSGKLRLEVRTIDLPKVIRAGMETVRTAADARGVRLEAVLEAEAGVVRGDEARLQQVVWNLLTNAVKFTPKGGLVRVVLRPCGQGHLDIVVSDTGAGIEPQFLPHMFDRFRQADSSITRKHTGLGLGLAIVRHLVELHGGTVWAHSEGPGRGADFTVRLPLATVEPAPPPEPAAVRSEPGATRTPFDPRLRLDRLRILVVDDQEDARVLLDRVLTERGAEVATAASVADAVRCLEGARFDILISDIGMPDEDGYQLIQRVRSMSAGQGGDIPALALTAYARVEDQEKALESGFDLHLTKPIDTVQLIEAVSTLADAARPG